MFRPIDWLTMVFTFAVVMGTYYVTLAPELTLEDSGELCTGSFYAGIPHPPGYPFWAIYSWVWTKILPWGNIAWRVEVGEALAAALACGLVALMVCRGSSMLMEGIEELKQMQGRWESAICAVSGAVAGLMLGFGGVMWSESVAINRISLFGVPWVALVLLCLMRWIYAPHQRRYLYCALFFFGICFTVHQTLLVAAMGIEVVIGARHPRYGRTLCLGNSILFAAGLILNSEHYISMLDTAKTVLTIYYLVGVLSMAAYVWLAVVTNISFRELSRDGVLAATGLLMVASPALRPLMGGPTLVMLGLVGGCTFGWLAWQTRKVDLGWLLGLVLAGLWMLGASFYLYEAIAGMTDPPMQWGYPRTVEGFFHALSRGQYERANASNVLGDPKHFMLQLGMLVSDIAGEFNWVVLLIALVPLLFFLRMQKRERAWVGGLAAMYGCIGFLLLILMNPAPDRQSADLNRVFFTSSHAVIAIMAGYGLALTAAYMATHYSSFRRVGLILGGVVAVPALLALHNGVSHTFYGDVGALEPMTVFFLFLWLVAGLVAAALTGWALLRMTHPEGFSREVADYALLASAGLFILVGLLNFYLANTGTPMLWRTLLLGLALVAAMGQAMLAIQSLLAAPTTANAPVLSEELKIYLMGFGGAAVVALGTAIYLAFFHAECLGPAQVLETLPRIFAPQQYCLPVVAGLLILGVVVVFIGALVFYRHRAPLAITLGLFVLMPLASALSHWANSEQRNHYFGYWFGHDMFTPPFQGSDGKPLYPEMDKDTILYGGTDPGRFCPTYMIFCESFTPHNCQPALDQKFDRRDVYLITQNALADPTYLDYLRAQYQRSQQHDPPFFSELARFLLKDKDYETNILAQMVKPLDTIFEARGARIEKRWRTSTSWFEASDFLDLPGLAARLRPADSQDPVSKWVYGQLSDATKQRLSQKGEEARLGDALAKDLNAMMEREWAARKAGKSDYDGLYNAQRFSGVAITPYLKSFIEQNPQSDTRIRLDRELLEAAYPGQIAKSLGGVYPDREIYMASDEDRDNCARDYAMDIERRARHDARFPNEAKQLVPGEVVNKDNGAVQFSSQVSVMALNGLVAKVIFDHNPRNEFYVEESMPLAWMYPRLTPFGIIMKVNRETLPQFPPEAMRRDHEFWTQYSGRLIGNWITYDTSVKDTVAFVEKVFLQHNFQGFNGDPAFIRDEQAQKSFSKLREAIAGIYLWRLGMMNGYPTPPQYLPRTEAERQQIIREADFALRQSFAFCPYSPETLWRYVDLLINIGRSDDATLIADTCHKLDPNNPTIANLAEQLDRPHVLLKEHEAHPDDFQIAFDLEAAYLGMRQDERAAELLNQIVANTNAPGPVIYEACQFYTMLHDNKGLERATTRFTQIQPDRVEAWLELAAMRAQLGMQTEALDAVRHALDANTRRRVTNQGSPDLRDKISTDDRLAGLHNTTEWKNMFPGK